MIKGDWYGHDHRYVRDHPDCLFWRVLMHAPNPPQYLPFIPIAALHQQLDYIRIYYSQPDSERLLERPFPYLNEATMTRFVVDTAATLRQAYSLLPSALVSADVTSALDLLPQALQAPYPPPLGDVVE